MSNDSFKDKIQYMIDAPVSELRIGMNAVASVVTNVEDKLLSATETLETELSELREENSNIRKQGYATLDQLDTLVHHQLKTIDSVIVGLRTCSQLSTNINNQLTTKIKRLTRLTALLGLLSIAAILFAILR